MKKLMKRVVASVAATTVCLTMAISASAATQDDVVATAKNCAVPTNNVSELSNYLVSHTDKFTSADYDYMVSAIQSTYNANVAPYLDGMDPANLTAADYDVLYSKVPAENKQAIISDLKAVGTKYGVTIKVTKLARNKYTVSVEEPNSTSNGTAGTTKTDDNNGKNTVIASTNGGSEKALNTGAGSVAVEAAAIALLAIALGGTVVVSKKNKKVEL